MLRPTISPVEHCKYSDFCSMQRSFSEYYFFKYKDFGAFTDDENAKISHKIYFSMPLSLFCLVSESDWYRL